MKSWILSVVVTVASGTFVSANLNTACHGEPAGVRTVQFPAKASESPGTLLALPVSESGNVLKKQGRLLGPAVGAISVAKDEVLYLIVTPEGASKLSCLSKLKPKDLHQIRMHDVHLAKNALTEISKLKGLQDLDLSNTDVDDKGLKTVAQCADLRKLDLSKTLVQGAGIGDLRGLTKLKDLDIGNNGVNDFFVSTLVRSLPKLEALNLSETKISDAALAHVAKLKHLRKLNVQGNKITDTGLNALNSSTNLKLLNLKETLVTPQGKRNFRQSLPKCEVRN